MEASRKALMKLKLTRRKGIAIWVKIDITIKPFYTFSIKKILINKIRDLIYNIKKTSLHNALRKFHGDMEISKFKTSNFRQFFEPNLYVLVTQMNNDFVTEKPMDYFKNFGMVKYYLKLNELIF